MKLNDYSARLSVLFDRPISEFTELRRALSEQSSHFGADDDLPALEANLLKGRSGPGGGLDVTPFIATFVLLAVLVDGPRREAALRTWKAWHFNQEGSVTSGWRDGESEPSLLECPLTQQHLFGDALRSILSDVDLAVRVDQISVSSNRTAEIRFDKDKVSRFDKGHRSIRPMLYSVSVLDGIAVHGIAALLKLDPA